MKHRQPRRFPAAAGACEENAAIMKAPSRSRGLYLFRCGSDPTPHLAGVINPGLCVGPNAHQHTIQNRLLTRGERRVQPHIVTDCVTHVGGSFSCQDGSSVPVLITVRKGCDSHFYRTGVRFQSVTEAIRLIAFLFFDCFEEPHEFRRPGAPRFLGNPYRPVLFDCFDPPPSVPAFRRCGRGFSRQRRTPDRSRGFSG